MTYPLKFRQHVLAIREKEKLTFDQTAKRFGVGIPSLMRWSKNPSPVMKLNKPATRVDMQALRQELIARPDDYQYERAQRPGVSQRGICDALKRPDFTRKKQSVIPKPTPQAGRLFRPGAGTIKPPVSRWGILTKVALPQTCPGLTAGH